MEEDRDGKKRRMEEEEEEKMEKMYALLKHARDMRKHLSSSTERDERTRREEERALARKHSSSQTEDFSGNAELNNAANAGPSTSKKDESRTKREEPEGNSNLDLNLSL